MKEKKFRAWNYRMKELIYFDLDEDFKDFYLHIKETTMQYLNLKDKNGKEAYEHDIIKLTEQEFDEDGNYIRDILTRIIELPEMNDFNFYTFLNSSEHNKKQEFEIIGDKFQNPELYKEISNE